MFKLINSKIKLFGKVLLLGNGVPPTTEPPTTEPPTSDEPPSGESTTGPDPYLAFLSGNVGVNQYTGPGAMNGTWAWSHNGGYASEEAATAAMNAAEG
jgi:hypothetical protein